MLRCKDSLHYEVAGFKPSSWEPKLWCKYARNLRTSDPQWINYANDGRSENWAKICDKTGENATWNKKCNVDEVRCSCQKVSENA